MAGTNYFGEIKLISFNFAPRRWTFCDGRSLPINQNQALFSLLGTTYGGNGQTTFALPDLRGRVPIHVGNGHGLGEKAGSTAVTVNIQQLPTHVHQVQGSALNANTTDPTGHVLAAAGNAFRTPDHLTTLSPLGMTSVGGSQAHNNMQPYLALNYIIATGGGLFPEENSGGGGDNFTPFLGEIRMFGGDFAPQGWALCQGQTLAISENDPLYQLIGTTYGGDGQETFNLPNLASRIPLGVGTGPDGTTYQLGEMAGTEEETLTVQQIPNHNHALEISRNSGNRSRSANTVLAANSSLQVYREDTPTVSLHSSSLTSAGGSQPHTNLQPFLTINYIIATSGIFPFQ
jgi:microcystin-dependent protein